MILRNINTSRYHHFDDLSEREEEAHFFYTYRIFVRSTFQETFLPPHQSSSEAHSYSTVTDKYTCTQKTNKVMPNHCAFIMFNAVFKLVHSQSVPDFVRAKIPCKPSEFHCYPSNICINETYVCNNYPNCPDQSDELNCDNFLAFSSNEKPPTSLKPSTASQLITTSSSQTAISLKIPSVNPTPSLTVTRPSADIIKDSILQEIDRLLLEKEDNSQPTTTSLDSFLSEIGLADIGVSSDYSDFVQISTLQN